VEIAKNASPTNLVIFLLKYLNTYDFRTKTRDVSILSSKKGLIQPEAGPKLFAARNEKRHRVTITIRSLVPLW
jgi:hypothetical protein